MSAVFSLPESLPSTSTLYIPLPPHPIPEPWNWRCHGCGATYRFSATSRCIDCSHRFCSSKNAPIFPPIQRRRRPRKGLCISSFDFSTWIVRNEWRRELAAQSDAMSTTDEAGTATTQGVKTQERWQRRRHRALKKRRNEMRDERWERIRSGTAACWGDCDYPGQCFHEREVGPVKKPVTKAAKHTMALGEPRSIRQEGHNDESRGFNETA